jgi:hypothetical protein
MAWRQKGFEDFVKAIERQCPDFLATIDEEGWGRVHLERLGCPAGNLLDPGIGLFVPQARLDTLASIPACRITWTRASKGLSARFQAMPG